MVLHMDICGRFERRLGAYVDGELDAVHSAEVEDHVEGCAACREQLAMIRAMRNSLRRVGRLRAPSSLRERLLAAVAQERAAEEAAERSLPFAAELPLALEPARASSPGLGAAERRASKAAKPGLAPRTSHLELVGGRGAPPRPAEQKRSRLRYLFPLAAAAMFAIVLAGVWERSESAGTTAATNDTAPGDEPATAAVAAGLSEPQSVSDSESHLPNLGLPDFNSGSPDSSIWSFPGLSGEGGARVAPTGATLASLDSLVEDLVKQHAEPLPPETTDPRGLERFDKYVGVKVTKPRYEPYGGRYLGARLHPVRDRRAAMLQYVLGNQHRVTVFVFDPRGLPMHAQVLTSRSVGQQPVLVGQLRGYTVAASEARGVGYALASDLDDKESTKLMLAAAKR